jgi:hypothetical protein
VLKMELEFSNGEKKVQPRVQACGREVGSFI